MDRVGPQCHREKYEVTGSEIETHPSARLLSHVLKPQVLLS